MQPRAQRPEEEIPLMIVGGNEYGRFPKISDAQTFNMVISDNWLVPYAGYKKVLQITTRDFVGRAIYTSTRGGFMIAVIGNTVYKIQGTITSLNAQAIFDLNTYTGDVFIDENNASQICIADGQNLWVYNWFLNTIEAATLPINTQTGLQIKPGYVTFHDTYIIVPDLDSSYWYLSAPNDALNWLWGAGDVAVAGALQTKPDNSVAVLRAPGKGSLIYVFGENVTEMWNDVGAQLFPYQRNNSTSIDFGCLSPSTIAAMGEQVIFLGINERSGPVIISCTGSNVKEISTDGIDYKLERLVNPAQSYAFFYKEAGHTYYQLTFTDPADNISFLYDVDMDKFFTPTDEDLNYHPAERVAFFNNTYYFVSLNDGNLYELSYAYTNYDYTDPSTIAPNPNTPDVKTIPRIRICPPLRKSDNSRFVSTTLSFPIEQGQDTYFKKNLLSYITTEDGLIITEEAQPGYVGAGLGFEYTLNPYMPRIDISVSRDGAESFTGYLGLEMNPLGKRKNRVMFNNLGEANDLTCQFRFYSLSRMEAANGVMEIRKNEVEVRQ
jgi:hypothetical protein